MAAEHIIKSYDEELQRLNNMIVAMGGLAESQLAAAVEVVIARDSDRAIKPMVQMPVRVGLAVGHGDVLPRGKQAEALCAAGWRAIRVVVFRAGLATPTRMDDGSQRSRWDAEPGPGRTSRCSRP